MKPAAGALVSLALLAACSSTPPATQDAAQWGGQHFARWQESDPAYVFFPGDTVEVIIHTAPELSRTAEIGPDGRINLPLITPAMVADKTAPEIAGTVADRYAGVLRDPIVEARPAAFAAQNIIVGGEVSNPGLVEMTSSVGALEAVMLAGGFENTANRREVAVLRRSPGGGVMMRRVDLSAALRGDVQADALQLRRHDIVFVPRSTIAEINVWVDQYIRGLLPLDAGFSYALADAFNN
jgi:polysaccharide export outer membrane protein